MKRHFSLFVISLMVAALHSTAQVQPHSQEKHDHQDREPLPKAPEKIEWSKAVKLSWKDYKGKYNDTRKNPMMTFVSTFYNHFANQTGDTILIEVVPIFYPADSYVKPELKNKASLENAQVLFDLYEVWARKLRKEIMTTQFAKQSYSVYLQSMYKTNLQARNVEILKYNNETKGGKDAAKQKEWTAKIKKELAELEKYNKKNLRVRVK